MKHLKLKSVVLILTLFAGATFSSCSDDTSELLKENQNSQKTLSTNRGNSRLLWDPVLVARTHNTGLDYIFEQLKDNPKLANIDEAMDFFEDKDKEFIISNGLNPKYESYIPSIITQEDITQSEENMKSIFSNKFVSEYEYLHNLINQANSDYNSTIETLDGYNPNKKIKSDWEYTILMTMAKVGEFSLEYWKSNVQKWAEVLNKPEQGNKTTFGFLGFDWGDVGRSDAEGAVTTAVGLFVDGTGEALCATGPEGVAATGMVIAAGGIASSAVDFYNQYLDLF